MCFATESQVEAISRLKSCPREFSPSDPKDDGRRADEDVAEEGFDGSKAIETDL